MKDHASIEHEHMYGNIRNSNMHPVPPSLFAGPIAELPYLKRVAVAHQIHHSHKYDGLPWGMFLGPQELEAIGAGPELDAMVAEMDAGKRSL